MNEKDVVSQKLFFTGPEGSKRNEVQWQLRSADAAMWRTSRCSEDMAERVRALGFVTKQSAQG